MRNLYLTALLCFSCSLVFSQNYKMAAIGSSTTGGSGAWPLDSSWVSRFSYYYKNEKGILDSAYRMAVGGYSCYKGMPTSYTPPGGRPGPDPNNNVSRAVTVLSDLADPQDGVIIVNYPSNDYQTYSIAEIMVCLQTIYDSAVAAGHKCFITTTQPRTDGAFGTSAMKRKLADIKDSTINRFGVDNTLNFWDGMYNPADTTILPAYASGDDIHFNNAGHRELFERVVAKNVFNIILPVTIQQFKATVQNKQVNLQWSAHHDDVNSYFIVQRSSNGIRFESLKQINVKEGNGNIQYQYTDQQPLAGRNYYRLAVYEPGKKYYSKTITANTILPGIVIKRLYPVPAKQTITLEIQSTQVQPVSIDLVNSSGIRLKTQTYTLMNGENIIRLPVTTLPSGNYFVRIQCAGHEPVMQSFTR